MSIRIAIISLAVFGIMTGFQNCGAPANVSTDIAVAGSQKNPVIDAGPSQSYSKIVYDPLLEISSQNKSLQLPRLEIDVEQGLIQVEARGSTLKCVVDVQRLNALKSILATARICEIRSDSSSGEVFCLSMPSADIELSNTQSQVLLKPKMCGRGTLLCDGMDKALPEVLNSLRDNPPNNCSI